MSQFLLKDNQIQICTLVLTARGFTAVLPSHGAIRRFAALMLLWRQRHFNEVSLCIQTYSRKLLSVGEKTSGKN